MYFHCELAFHKIDPNLVVIDMITYWIQEETKFKPFHIDHLIILDQIIISICHLKQNQDQMTILLKLMSLLQPKPQQSLQYYHYPIKIYFPLIWQHLFNVTLESQEITKAKYLEPFYVWPFFNFNYFAKKWFNIINYYIL